MFHKTALQSPIRSLASLACALLTLASLVSAQAPQRGPRHIDPRWHALVHATLIPAPGEQIDDATIVLQGGMIVSVESGAEAPAGARTWDCTGLFIYAGLIEPYFEVEASAPTEQGSHWNALVTPERSALDGDGISKDDREMMRSLGFTAASLSPEGGVLRGTSELVALGDSETDTASATAERLASQLYQAFAFETAPYDWSPGGPSRAGDPSSQMGSIALLRQTFSDADWYARSLEIYSRAPQLTEPPAAHPALEALGTGRDATRLLFDSRSELETLRAARLASEFNRELILLGSGTEYRRLAAIRELGVAVLCPLNFPKEPEVASFAQADRVSLRSLMSWEQAPANPRRLIAAEVPTALTTAKLKSRKKTFWSNLRRAIEHGLLERDALAMLTTRTAELLGVEGAGGLGRVATGYQAHLVVTDGALFDDDTEIRDVWVGGRRYEVNPAPDVDYDGEWTGMIARTAEREPLDLSFTLKKKKLTLTVGEHDKQARKLNRTGDRIDFLFEGDELGRAGTWTFSGRFGGEELFGSFADSDGQLIAANFTRRPVEEDSDDESPEANETERDDESSTLAIPESWPTPFGAYGLSELPAQDDVLFTNAIVWTSGPDGIIEKGAVLISGGLIQYVGPALRAPDAGSARVIDLKGAHLTPGMIDCHSHTGISGAVNEMGQRVTSEVRVNDVINPDDINWYRQLAGGMTAANQLHGSGNAVGGQNSVVKNRWGAPHPDGMRFSGAMPGIKFALGENPKRVAQQTQISDEYPQTRMGVATLIRDRLLAGREYRAKLDAYAALPDDLRGRTMPPRRDLELEALGEITANERFIHSHSYRQDEILMLCKTADQLGFKIGTFQHVLEGYKVAEAISKSALGASTFADWWAYKLEVIDAIPSNAGIMHDVGVVTSINSDSADHARRLNTEAAKLVKYGGMTSEDALKLVTINPAIQLGIEDRVGSVEVGKDADLAIWSGNPLSYTSRCERTFVDGRELFSIGRDDELRAEANRERQRIIQKILSKTKPKEKDSKGEGDEAGDLEDQDDPEFDEFGAGLRAGYDMESALQGDCGCTHRTLTSQR